MSERNPMESLFSAKAESGVIGGILINPQSFHQAIHHMTVDDFYIHSNRYMWEAIAHLLEDGVDVDTITLRSQLDRMGHEDVHDGMIIGVMNDVPSSLHIVSYAKELAELGARRRLYYSANDAVKKAFDLTVPLDVGEVAEDMYVSVRTRGKTAEAWDGALDEFHLDLLERMETPYSDVWGMSYGRGFTKLNRATGGAHTSEFVILAGEPGIGKSVIVGDWVAEFSLQERGAVYSMEMPSNTWIRRLVSRQSHESARNLMRGELQDSASVMRAINDLRNNKIFLSDHEEWSSDELRADLTRLVHQKGIKWVVIDHMGLLSDVGDDPAQSTRVAQRLRKTARKLELHMMTIAPVTKDGMQGTIPNMSNVRGSGEVLHEADVVYWLNPFTPLTEADKTALKQMTGEQKYNTHNRMRTFFTLKGRHLSDPNMHKHLSFAQERPTLAEADFPPVVAREMPVPYSDN